MFVFCCSYFWCNYFSKVVSVSSCFFFCVCFLRMNCFTEPVKPRNESSFEIKRIDRWYINSICLYCNREWFGGISLLYHRCDEICFVSWVPWPPLLYTQCLLSTGFVEHDTPDVFSFQKAHGLDSIRLR